MEELSTRGVAEYSDFGPIERCIPEWWKIGGKLVLITNRTSHMSFRLVPNWVTLDDLERRISPNRRVISPNSVAFGADCVKLVEDTQIPLQRKCSPKNLVFSFISFMTILAGDHPQRER